MVDVPVAGLNALTPLMEVGKDFVENFNAGILIGRVGTLDPHQVPCKDRLCRRADFPTYLWDV